MVPRPRTRPHPPVVVAATSPATAELAAARGCRSCPDAYAEWLCRVHPVGTAADCTEVMAATARRTGSTT